MHKALIVCLDLRAEALAQVLIEHFHVYRCKKEDVLVFSQWRNQKWEPLQPTEHLPTKFEVLFFHTGMSDPASIPPNIEFEQQFAFSSPGLAVGKQLVKGEAVPIPRPFTSDTCPIRNEHVLQLKEVLEGKRSELPDFCAPEPPIEVLPAMAILCQGYLAAQGGAELEDWDKVEGKVREAAFRQRDVVKESSWWLEIWGIKQGQVASDPKLVETKKSEVAQRIRDEWQGGQPEQLAKVMSLVDAVFSLRKMEKKVVKDAYEAFCSRFSGAKQ